MILSLLESAGALIFVFFFIGLCIFSHELGHFLAGRWRKMHIDAFSIGFKKVWSKKINGVEYRIGCIPLGGYVELPQVDATDEIPKAADGTELKRAKPLDRIITAVAGPLFNIIFGFLLGCAVWFFGVPQDSPTMRSMKVTQVEQKSPEYQAGLRPGDIIVRVNGEKFSCTWIKFVEKIMFSVGQISLDVVRDGKNINVLYTPVENPNAPGRMKHEKIGYPFFQVQIPIELHPQKNSPAARSGIRRGDVLLAVNGINVTGFEQFAYFMSMADGKALRLTVDRNGKKMEFNVAPEPIPDLSSEFEAWKIGVGFHPGVKQPSVSFVMPLSPAARAGMKPGDTVLKLDGRESADTAALIKEIAGSNGRELTFEIKRHDNSSAVLKFSAVKQLPRDIGVELLLLNYPSPWEQFEYTLATSYKSLRGMVVGGANLLGLTDKTSTIKPRHMSGPLGMGTMLYQSVKHVSLMTGLYFVVMISFALAIFNLLPLPVLDGGHITFAIIELIIRRPIPTPVIKALSATFIALLISLMLYITYFDVLRTYRSFAGEKNSNIIRRTTDPAAKATENKNVKPASQP